MPSLRNKPSGTPLSGNRSQIALLLTCLTGLTACAHSKSYISDKKAFEDEMACSDEIRRLDYGYDLDAEPGPDFEKCSEESQADFMARREETKKRQDESDCRNELARLGYGYDDDIEPGPDFEKCSEESQTEVLSRREERAKRKAEQLAEEAAREEERARRDACRAERNRLHEDLNVEPGEDFEACTEEEKADILEYRSILGALVKLDKQELVCVKAEEKRYKKMIDEATARSEGKAVSVDLTSGKEPKACRKYEKMRREYNRRVTQYFDGKQAKITN